MDELLHDQDMATFCDNYRSRSEENKFKATHKILWATVTAALIESVNPEVLEKAIKTMYNHRFTYNRRISSEIEDTVEINEETLPKRLICKRKKLGKIMIR